MTRRLSILKFSEFLTPTYKLHNVAKDEYQNTRIRILHISLDSLTRTLIGGILIGNH